MTGRRLYDAICDAWAAQGSWARTRESASLFPPDPVAWPFLTGAERSTFNSAARKITPKPKKVAS